MSATGFCHCCEIPTQLTSTESPTCLKCQSSFVEVYDLAPAACLPDVKQPRLNNANTDQPGSDADITCSICLGEWTSGGEHRLVSLKCGHLFGESCIAKWLQAKGKCAECKQENGLDDIRRLFVRSIKAVDTVSLAGQVMEFNLTDLCLLFVGSG